MARVTVEDCLLNVKNRFELVMLASKRSRQLMRGSAEPKVAWENDKATVVALREIAMGYTDFSDAHHAEMVPYIHPKEKEVDSLELDETSATDAVLDLADNTAQSHDTTAEEDFTPLVDTSPQAEDAAETDPDAE